MKDRTFQSMSKKFITRPNDIFSIKYNDCITNTINLEISNSTTNEFFALTLSNIIEAWELLKDLSEMGARSVVVEQEDLSIVPFAESAPFKCRFISN